MRKFKNLLNVFLIVTFVSCTSITVFAETIHYSQNPNIVQQAKTQWCWAASAEMAAKSIYPNTNRTQWDGVAQVKGSSSVNLPASSIECTTATNYICYNNANFKVEYFPWNMSSIRRDIMDYQKPLIFLAGYYDNYGNRNGGHFVVGDAVYEYSNYFRYRDPWDSTTHWVDYQAFCNGNYNSRQYEETVFAR
ncbi:papain-like cysteine protease family protein [Clostridium frigidicarnis]|uniref:Peptidase_C39 like family protein n=1 Tax=Clostridium frigidicarnis TaxID=84698 RepID=A0A1I0YZE3_9CLOT|nr:papain-like cysteine protease family protein [Clostridium frigidicarnis]SFB18809.1 hypothetical protein SAMN04488528_101660 [Clostridium frigidicarnis]